MLEGILLISRSRTNAGSLLQSMSCAILVTGDYWLVAGKAHFFGNSVDVYARWLDTGICKLSLFVDL